MIAINPFIETEFKQLNKILNNQTPIQKRLSFDEESLIQNFDPLI